MIRIYITDLAAYNQAKLIGKWITLPMESSHLKSEIDELLKAGTKKCKDENSPHEEYFITDYDKTSHLAWIEVGEYTDPFTLNSKLEELESLENDILEKIDILVREFSLDSNNIDYLVEETDNLIEYEEDSIKEIAENYIEEVLDLDSLPNIIRNNINYESIARDMKIERSFVEIDGKIFEYNN